MARTTRVQRARAQEYGARVTLKRRVTAQSDEGGLSWVQHHSDVQNSKQRGKTPARTLTPNQRAVRRVLLFAHLPSMSLATVIVDDFSSMLAYSGTWTAPDTSAVGYQGSDAFLLTLVRESPAPNSYQLLHHLVSPL